MKKDISTNIPECPFIPAENRVILLMEEGRDKIGSIYIPDTAKDAPLVGRVIAVGPGEWDSVLKEYTPVEAEVGDRVIFSKYAGNEIDWVDDKTYLFLNHSDIIAYIKPEKRNESE